MLAVRSVFNTNLPAISSASKSFNELHCAFDNKRQNLPFGMAFSSLFPWPQHVTQGPYVQCLVMLESSHRQCPDCSHPSSSSPFRGYTRGSSGLLSQVLVTLPHRTPSFLGNSHCFIPSSLKTIAQCTLVPANNP